MSGLERFINANIFFTFSIIPLRVEPSTTGATKTGRLVKLNQ